MTETNYKYSTQTPSCMLKKVLCFGTFDLLHKGHEAFLKEAKMCGDVLYVVIARDTSVRKIKQIIPTEDQETRKGKVAALPFVDHAVLGNEDDYYCIVEEINPDIICLGYDQNAMQLEQELKKRNINAVIKRLPAYKPALYKTSIMKLKGDNLKGDNHANYS